MKKIIGILSCFLFVMLAILGCSCNKDDDKKASLSVGDMNATTYQVINLTEYNTKINNKEDFVLYLYSEYCGGCAIFSPILNKVIEEKHLIIYAIDNDQIPDGHALDGRMTASLLIYDDGKILKEISQENDKDKEIFEGKDNLISFLNQYTNMPTMYYINKIQLDEKINNHEDFIVYYALGGCSDCKSIDKNFLREFLDNNPNSKTFYIVETKSEGFRLKDGIADSEQWIQFKADYGLSKTNKEFGYGEGYVPTFHYYKDGEIKAMAVYFNDTKETVSVNNDGTKTIKITDSYYSDNPYLLNEQTMLNTEYDEKLKDFFNAKIQAFFDNYLGLVD